MVKISLLGCYHNVINIVILSIKSRLFEKNVTKTTIFVGKFS